MMYHDSTDESHFGPDIHDPVNSLLDCESNNPFGLQMKPKINESSSFEDMNVDNAPQLQQMGLTIHLDALQAQKKLLNP